MDEGSGIEARYPTYNWEGRLSSLRRTVTGVKLLGLLFLLGGLAVTILGVLNRLPVAPSQKIMVIAVALITGLIIFAVCITMAALLTVALEMEEQMRYATNIWRILEERDQAEENGGKSE